MTTDAAHKWLVAGITAALIAALAAFFHVSERFGPAAGEDDAVAHPGRVLTFVCTEADCGKVYVTPLSEEVAADPSRWPAEIRCPFCGGVMRRAERCTSCGALVPTPADGHVLGARCPECGGEIFGPIGGRMPLQPIRPQNEGEETP